MISLNCVQLASIDSSTKGLASASSKSSSDTSQDFNTTLKKSSDNSQNRTSKVQDVSDSKSADEITEDSNDTSKDIKSVNKDGSSKKVELSEKLKGDLKKAGFSDEDIKELEEKLSQGSISENSLMYLINVLLKNDDNLNLQGNSSDFTDEISNKISSEISQNLNYITADNKEQNTGFSSEDIVSKVVKENLNDLCDILEQFGTSKEFDKKLMEKLSSNILSKLAQEGNVSDKVKSEVNAALSKELNLNTLQEGSIGNLYGFKIQNQDTSNQVNINTANLFTSAKEESSENISKKGSNNSSAGNNESFTGSRTSSSEEDVLKKIIEGDTGDRISKAINFMSQFKSLNTDNSIQNLQDIVINKNSFDSDIIKTLKYMDVNNVKELTVKINPKELGEITINLTMQEGKLKAVLTASNKEAYNLLNANLQDISNKIQTNDIKIQGLSLNIYNEDATFFRDESGKEQYKDNSGQNKNSTLNNISEDREIVQNNYYDNNNVNILA
ncbi:flagellar hook-length control protein FliK [Clostridium sp. WILCCON 0269]|uniref:Flagellar hook-length control protein FliK n=1 Tax=Candidatus Clostridium eludens TaxID=3381663 RepID=A0ABW8SHM4_9CLOT